MTSFIAAIVIYLGFAVGRLISWFLDGKPNKPTAQGFMPEIIFSALNIFCLIHLELYTV